MGAMGPAGGVTVTTFGGHRRAASGKRLSSREGSLHVTSPKLLSTA